MARRNNIDWSSIELDVRLGQLSIRQIALKHRIADSNLRARIKREGWTPDCATTIRQATERAVADSVLTRAEEIGAEIGAQKAQQFRDCVQEAVIDSTEAVQHHRRDTRRALAIAKRLLSELEGVEFSMPALVELAETLSATKGARAALLERAISLKSRAEALDRVAAAMSKLTAMERQAHGLDKVANEKGADIDELLLRVHMSRMAALDPLA